MDDLEDLVTIWAGERNLIKGSTPQAQMLKMTEEVGELAAAIAKNDLEAFMDSVGDCMVVLTILAAQKGLRASDCFYEAYQEIKDRKGKMVDGVFVKNNENTSSL